MPSPDPKTCQLSTFSSTATCSLTIIRPSESTSDSCAHLQLLDMAFGHDSTTNRASAEPTHFKKLCQAEKTPTPGRQYVSSASAVTSQLGPSARPALPLRFRIRQYMRHNCPHNPKDMKANAQVLTNLVLLERILKQVPCDTVLLSRRVCRAWQDTIIGSFRLQQSLFLEPCGPLLSPFGNPGKETKYQIRESLLTMPRRGGSPYHCARQLSLGYNKHIEHGVRDSRESSDVQDLSTAR